MNKEPAPRKVIRDLETLRVLSDPLRMQIVALLRERARPVKEVAQALGLPPSRLYYHFKLLEQHGLIRVVHTRLVSGIVEKHYRAAAYAFDVDRSLLGPGAGSPGAEARAVHGAVERVQQDLDALLAQGHDPATAGDTPMRLSLAMARLSPEQARAFVQQLAELVAAFEATAPPEGQQAAMFTLFVAFYPTPSALGAEDSPTEEPS